MAAGTKTDFVIYDVEFFSGATEILEQYADDIGTAVGGAINIVSMNQKGDFEKQSFFKNVAGLVGRRDAEVLTPQIDSKLEQGEHASVKINGKIVPVMNTIDSFKKIGQTPEVMSFVLGQQYGKGITLDHLNTGISCLATAMATENGMVYDTTATTAADPDPEGLTDTLALMGDAASRVVAWVMHSNSYFKLVKGQIADKVTGIADVIVYGGMPGTLGRTVYVTDSSSLVITDGVSSGVDAYRVMGLTQDALTLNQSEDNTIISEVVTGLENLGVRIQGEYAFTVNVKGFSYVGTANPTDAELATGANWSYNMTDVKSGPGVMGIFS